MILTLGVLLITFAVPQSLSLLSPGELSREHATLDQCSSCHASVEGGFSQWVSSVFGEYDHNKDSAQCQSCHDLGDNAYSAHSLSPAQLEQLSPASTADGSVNLRIRLASSLFAGNDGEGNTLGCNSCHKEHLGVNHNAASINDEMCVVCHQVQFQGFSNGHPGFSNYPNDRRTHLNFDHVSHIEKNFKEDGNQEFAPQACLDCHVTQVGGGKMVTRSFEQTCESCHSSQIEGIDRASAKGIAVLGLPGLDVETLADRNIAIGEWPEFAEDGLSPYMRLLLGTTPGFADVEKTLAGMDLLDLTDANEDQLSRIKDLVWMVKEFYYDLEVGGSQVLSGRFAGMLPAALDKQHVRELLAALPPDLIEAARTNWFPSLHREVEMYRDGIEVAPPLSAGATSTETSDAVDAALDKLFDWFPSLVREVDEYRAENEDSSPLSTDADSTDTGGSVDAAFDELFADDADNDESTVDAKTESEFDALFGEDENGQPEVELDAKTESEFDALFGEDDEAGQSTGGLDTSIETKSESEFDQLFGDEENSSGQDESKDDDEFSIEELDDADEIGTSGLNDNEQQIPEDSEQVSFEDFQLPSEDRAGAGGWYRDEFNLRYRPTGHADRFVKAWVDLGAGGGPEALSSLFGDLTDRNSPGTCMKCHSVDVLEDQTTVNWKVRQSDPRLHEFNRFSHAAHFNLLDRDGCLTCHKFDKTADYAVGFEDQNPLTFFSNFESISQQTCAECHQEKLAGESCLTCHNYHVGEFEAASILESKISTGN